MGGDDRLDVLHCPVFPARIQLGVGGHGQQGEAGRVLIEPSVLRHKRKQRLNEVLAADAFIRVDHRQHIRKQSRIQRVIRQKAGIQQVKVCARGKVNHDPIPLLLIGIGDGHDLDLILRVRVVEAHDGIQQFHRCRVGQGAVGLRIGVHLAAGVAETAQAQGLLDWDLSLFRADQAIHQQHVFPIRVIYVPQGVFQTHASVNVPVAQCHIHPLKQRLALAGHRVGHAQRTLPLSQQISIVAAPFPQPVYVQRRTEAQGFRVKGCIAVLCPEIQGLPNTEVLQPAVGRQRWLGENIHIGVDLIEVIHRAKQCPIVVKPEDAGEEETAALRASLSLKGDAHRRALPTCKVDMQHIVTEVVPPASLIQILPARSLLQKPPEAVSGIAQAP